jgi:hypothetical protein
MGILTRPFSFLFGKFCVAPNREGTGSSLPLDDVPGKSTVVSPAFPRILSRGILCQLTAYLIGKLGVTRQSAASFFRAGTPWRYPASAACAFTRECAWACA